MFRDWLVSQIFVLSLNFVPVQPVGREVDLYQVQSGGRHNDVANQCLPPAVLCERLADLGGFYHF